MERAFLVADATIKLKYAGVAVNFDCEYDREVVGKTFRCIDTVGYCLHQWSKIGWEGNNGQNEVSVLIISEAVDSEGRRPSGESRPYGRV